MGRPRLGTTEHTRKQAWHWHAWQASPWGLGRAGVPQRTSSQAPDEPSTRSPGCSLLTASPAGARHMSRRTLRGVTTRSILAPGVVSRTDKRRSGGLRKSRETPYYSSPLPCCASILAGPTAPLEPSNSQEASLSALIVPRPRGRASAASFWRSGEQTNMTRPP